MYNVMKIKIYKLGKQMLKKTIIFLAVTLIAIQFVPLEKTNPKVDDTLTLHTDEKVLSILKKSCYDCHSYETEWSIYSDIAPLSFGVVSHVEDGRKALNFSNYNNIDSEIKTARLKRTIKTITNGSMPVSNYLVFHEEARMSEVEKETLITWFEKELEKL